MNNIIERIWKQGGLVNIEDLRGTAFQAEESAHTFRIRGVDESGEPLALTGTVGAVFLRADNTDVAITGTITDGAAEVTLTDECYDMPGRFGLTIYVTSDEQTVAVYAAIGSVCRTSSGTVSPETGEDVMDLINAIAEAVETIPASYTDLMAAVAPTYSTSALYAIGSYAWYDGKLYRCTTAITSGETWTSAHWTLANLGSDVSDLKSAFVLSPNLFDSSENVVGLLLAANGILYPSYTDFVTSGYIPVTPGATLRAQYDADGLRHDISDNYGFQYYTSCFYDASKTFITGSGGNNTKLLTVPNGAAYFRFSITNASATINTNIAIIESESAEVLPYTAPDTLWYLKEQYIPDSYDQHIKEVVGIDTDGIILNLPEKIYAVTGIEFNIYFENITEDWTKYQWDVTCTKGRQMARGYNITPTSSDVGEFPLTIKASIDQNTYKEVNTTLVVTAATTGTGISIIVLGDSTTDNGQAVEKINTDFESANTTVQTLGTRGTAPNNHEGRSGWRAYNYLTSQTDNPFYNPSTATFDAAYYFANSGVSVPDWFFINLGINDVFGYADDKNLNSWIPIILGYYDTMVTSLKSATQSMKIGVCVTIPPNDSQDAFGKAYGCSQTRDRCKRNNTIWAEKLIDHFKNSEAERIYIVPIHTNLDTVYNMGLETLPVNARNTEITYESPIANGGVHPVESGYWQIADVYTAFLKGNAN